MQSLSLYDTEAITHRLCLQCYHEAATITERTEKSVESLKMESWPRPWLWAAARLWTAAAWSPWCSSNPPSGCCRADGRGQTRFWLLSAPYCCCQTLSGGFPQTAGGEGTSTCILTVSVFIRLKAEQCRTLSLMKYSSFVFSEISLPVKLGKIKGSK